MIVPAFRLAGAVLFVVVASTLEDDVTRTADGDAVGLVQQVTSALRPVNDHVHGDYQQERETRTHRRHRPSKPQRDNETREDVAVLGGTLHEASNRRSHRHSSIANNTEAVIQAESPSCGSLYGEPTCQVFSGKGLKGDNIYCFDKKDLPDYILNGNKDDDHATCTEDCMEIRGVLNAQACNDLILRGSCPGAVSYSFYKKSSESHGRCRAHGYDPTVFDDEKKLWTSAFLCDLGGNAVVQSPNCAGGSSSEGGHFGECIPSKYLCVNPLMEKDSQYCNIYQPGSQCRKGRCWFPPDCKLTDQLVEIGYRKPCCPKWR